MEISSSLMLSAVYALAASPETLSKDKINNDLESEMSVAINNHGVVAIEKKFEKLDRDSENILNNAYLSEVVGNGSVYIMDLVKVDDSTLWDLYAQKTYDGGTQGDSEKAGGDDTGLTTYDSTGDEARLDNSRAMGGLCYNNCHAGGTTRPVNFTGYAKAGSSCYSNCHGACHGACHGSRGWR